jgi:hypothetical protein
VISLDFSSLDFSSVATCPKNRLASVAHALALLGHNLAIHQNREFATVAVHQFDLEPRLFAQCVRHTGGMLPGPASDRALPDRYLLHGSISFCLGAIASPQGTSCTRRAATAVTWRPSSLRALWLVLG